MASKSKKSQLQYHKINLVNELNEMREDPLKYALKLAEISQDANYDINQEERNMLISASDFLKKYKTLPRFHVSLNFCRAARNLQCESGALSLIVPLSLDCHINKLASDKHIHKYGEPGKFVYENCSYGYINPTFIIAQILQANNEGIYGARRNLLQTHCILGYSIGEHKSMGNSCVILIADRFDEKGIENVKEETKEKHQEMQSVFSLNTNECLNTIFDLNFEDKD